MNDTFDDARVLAQHSAALRRLARGLVSDPNTADDLVQETWLGALRRWRRRGEATGPAGLRLGVRHRAISGHRKPGAEPLRDADALAGGGGDPSETASTLERYRILHEGLAGLREPYRRTLVARFVEEQRHAAIAKAEGISVDTVRTRITRGLALLREQLDRRFDGERGGGRGAWMAALAPLARPERSVPVVSAGALVAAAGVVVAVGGIATLAALAISDAAPSPRMESRSSLVSVASSGSPELVEPRDHRPATRTVEPSVQRAASVQEPPQKAQEAPAEPEPLTISGIAMDLEGNPAAGVTFALVDPPATRVRGGDLDKAPRTDAGGRFSVTLPDGVGERGVHNVAFGYVPSTDDQRSGTWRLEPLGALTNARAGTHGHSVVLDIDSTPPGRVTGTIPELEVVAPRLARSTTDVFLSADVNSIGVDRCFVVQGIEFNQPFSIEGVRPGRYSLLAGGHGLATVIRSGIVVDPGETTDVGVLSPPDYGRIVFDEVRMFGPRDSAPSERLGCYVTDGIGLHFWGAVRLGEEVALEPEADGLCAGSWTIHWQSPDLCAPTITLPVRPNEVTKSSLVVYRTTEVPLEIIPPEAGTVWGAISVRVQDADGRDLLEDRVVVRASTLDESNDSAVRTVLRAPMGCTATAIFATDTGTVRRIAISQQDGAGNKVPVLVDLR